ncbi:MAG TPA: fibronectin type III domain-containing protein [Silvibacterium sp.]|nr:fibronectin type III domain-containing protein [Silvibacterium sp.]
MNLPLRLAAASLCLPILMTAGCGMIAAPQPPSLKLPEPVTDLTAQRTADQVLLRWTMPKHSTDKLPLSGDQKVQVCRNLAQSTCMPAGDLLLAPGADGEYSDRLPAALTAGPPSALFYTVMLQNRSGRSAGPSNIAVTAAGAAPPQIAVLHAQAMTDGVVLIWPAQGQSDTIRIHRALVEKSGAGKSSLPLEQTLEFSGKEHGWVLDPDAALDHTYTYTVQRVAKAILEGKSVELDSAFSDSVSIDARDVFPPAVPSGLETVADPQARAIDLSWQPDTEADLAGYTVYRREAGSNATPQRISPPSQPEPSFRDTNVVPGHTYEYSVSAIDHDGNESSRSTEVEETLPQQ